MGDKCVQSRPSQRRDCGWAHHARRSKIKDGQIEFNVANGMEDKVVTLRMTGNLGGEIKGELRAVMEYGNCTIICCFFFLAGCGEELKFDEARATLGRHENSFSATRRLGPRRVKAVKRAIRRLGLARTLDVMAARIRAKPIEGVTKRSGLAKTSNLMAERTRMKPIKRVIRRLGLARISER